MTTVKHSLTRPIRGEEEIGGIKGEEAMETLVHRVIQRFRNRRVDDIRKPAFNRIEPVAQPIDFDLCHTIVSGHLKRSVSEERKIAQ